MHETRNRTVASRLVAMTTVAMTLAVMTMDRGIVGMAPPASPGEED